MSNHAPKVDPASWLLFLASTVAILLTVFILVSSLINTIQKNSVKGELDSTSLVSAASDNLKPIGASSTSDAPAIVADTGAARPGKEVYEAVCMACHATGVAGSPPFGDKAAWEPRVSTGLDALMTTAINGKGAMPARAGQNINDAELKAAILYMTKEAGFDLGSEEAPVAKAPAEAAPKEEAPAKEEVVAKEEAPKAEIEPAVDTKKEEAVTEVVTTATEAPKETAAVEAPAEKEAPEAPKEPEAPVVEAAVATAAVAETASATPAVDLEKGKAVYSRTCFACHATGVAGSPKLDDKAAWAPRIATGMEALYNTSLKGKGAMPAKGGNMGLTDEDVKAAVDYMVSVAK